MYTRVIDRLHSLVFHGKTFALFYSFFSIFNASYYKYNPGRYFKAYFGIQYR